MPAGYKAFTGALAFIGCISLFLTGELNPVFYLLLPGFFHGYIRYMRERPAASKWLIGAGSVVTIVFFFFDAFIFSADILIAVAHLTILFQVLKSFDMKDPWDNLQVFFMALLQLVVTSELTRSVAFGVVFILFVVALVGAITLAHFIKEGTVRRVRLMRPLGVISVAAVLLTVVFFVSMPRLKSGLFGRKFADAIKRVGFEDRIDLSSSGELKLDPTVVMRVEAPGAKPPYYFRGIALDYFDGRSWRDTMTGRWPLRPRDGLFELVPSFPDAVAQRISLEPIETDILFALDGAGAIELPAPFIYMDEQGSIYTPWKLGRRLMYTAYSAPAERPAARTTASGYLQVPPGLSPHVAGLARGISEKTNGGQLEQTLAIERYLASNYKYSLKLHSTGTLPPVEEFLFGSKEGYCEHYATAMALMLRTLGIPARVVTGFLGREVNPVGNYIIVRQRDAHTWVEAAIGGKWMRFDPTPAVAAAAPESPPILLLYLDALRLKWYRYVVSFSSADQKSIINSVLTALKSINLKRFAPDALAVKALSVKAMFRALFYASLVLLVVSSGLLLAVRKKKGESPPAAFESRVYLKLRRKVKRGGGNVLSSSTPAEVLQEARKVGLGPGAAELIRIYELARFGERKLTGRQRNSMRALLKSISTFYSKRR